MARTYGSGSVFQRGRDGKWIGQWEEPSADGRRRRRTVTAATEAQARKRMRAAQGSPSRSRPRTESVAAFFERWLTDVVAKTRRERTLLGYRAILAHAAGDLGEIDLGRLTPHDVQSYVNRLDRQPRTVRHYAACLRTAFAYAVRRGLLDRNPAADLDLPKVARRSLVPLTGAQLRDFLDATADDPLHPLYVTAAWTGMRQGELLGLRWEDVDLDRATIHVRHSLTRLPGRRGVRYDLTEPKTPKSRRIVPLLPVVLNELRALRKADLARTVRPKVDQGLVFAAAEGSPLPNWWVTREFQAAVERAHLPKLRFHDLRHGAATMLIESGADLATVSAILGHSNIGTTVDLYGHLTEGGKRRAMARLTEGTA